MTTSFPQFIRKFMKAPFVTIDSVDLQWHGFQFNILRDDAKLCTVLLDIAVIVPLLCWVLLGPDSTAEQVARLIVNIPSFLVGQLTFDQWISCYANYYGLGTHWSAAVIYGLLFVGLSWYFRNNLNIKNSENLAITTGFVGLSIATFELFWMSSYYYFQGQTWVLTFRFPQFRLILQNILFLTPGLIVILGMNWKDYTLNFGWKTWLFLFLTISFVLLWWFYPFPVQSLSVPVEGYGNWTSSPQFPQTMYTIDTNITDQIAVGEMYHVEAPDVHLTNNLTKIFWTLTFYSLAKIRFRKRKEDDTTSRVLQEGWEN